MGNHRDPDYHKKWYLQNRENQIRKSGERQKKFRKEISAKQLARYHATKTSESMAIRSEQQKKRYWANPEAARAIATNYRRLLRHEFLTEYGGKCACCGETEFAFLTLEHIFRDGNIERKQFRTTHQLLRQLKKQGWPKDRYEILCFNCNRATHELGICPHRRNTE